jgi:hypothetical protein
MKLIKFYLLLITISILVGCQNEPVDSALSSQGIATDGFFKADFDGQTFQTNTIECIYANGILVMEATRTPQNDSFSFVMDQISVGTFNAKDHLIAYQPANSTYGYWAENLNNPAENLGTITITSLDIVNKKVSGNFNFKGYWSDTTVPMAPKNFTNGSFTNISFTTQVSNPDSFSASVNGAAFTNPTIAVVTTTIGSESYISIAGNRTNDRISLTIKESAVVGTYTITGATTDAVQASYKITSPTYDQQANIGIVTITEKTNDRIKGTFNFSTPNTPLPYAITNGAFDVEY